MNAVKEWRELLDYDPQSGKFTWKKAGRRRRVGAIAGYYTTHGYVCIAAEGRREYAHRLALALVCGEFPAEEVDHINGDRKDNRFANLRPASRSENAANIGIKRHNKLRVKGVTQVGQRYRAEIRKNKQRHHLGYFATLAKAKEAYEAAAPVFHGNFANLGKGCGLCLA